MSTRVEKRNHKFKPVVRIRSKPGVGKSSEAVPEPDGVFRLEPSASSNIIRASYDLLREDNETREQLESSDTQIPEQETQIHAAPSLISVSQLKSNNLFHNAATITKPLITPAIPVNLETERHSQELLENDGQALSSGLESDAILSHYPRFLGSLDPSIGRGESPNVIISEANDNGAARRLQKGTKRGRDQDPHCKRTFKRACTLQDENEIPNTSSNSEATHQIQGSPAVSQAVRTSARNSVDTFLDAGDPLDPTITTMKDLCGIVDVGRVSSRHIEVQFAHVEAKKLEKDRRARLAAIREARDKRGEDLEDPRAPSIKTRPILPDLQTAVTEEETHNSQSNSAEDFDYQENLKTSHYTVAMRMDSSGQMTVDEDSLMIDRAADPEVIEGEEDMVHVEETDSSRFVNSSTHSRKAKGSRWSKEETGLFYNALQQFSTDFTLISLVLPGRSARECRNKFNSEDKKNKARIDWALSNPLPIDIPLLTRMTGKVFIGTQAVTPQHVLKESTTDDTTNHD